VLAQKQQLLVRYYLWAADGPWRLPSRLHYDLIDRKVALPQFADTKQKVLKVGVANWCGYVCPARAGDYLCVRGKRAICEHRL